MRIKTLTVALVLCLSAFATALAGDDRRVASELLRAGDIVPMEVVLRKASAEHPGHVLKTELEKERDAPSGWVYEVKILRDDGVVVEVEYDAKSLSVIKVERGGDDDNRKRWKKKDD
ncbi:MAG: PepSY domain-containing protein [Rhodospirillales bacterium]|nr:PepSY domain-containing protein [Rhodospirillales bacterium]